VIRKELLAALEIVKPGLASREMVEQSTSFAFLDGRVVSYNDEISISTPIKGLSIRGAVKAEELYALLGKLKADEIEVTIDGNEVQMKAGRAKAGFTLQQEIKLPLEEIGEIGKWKTLPEHFIEALKFSIPSCSRNMGQPLLTCINVRPEGQVISCDNYRMTRYVIAAVPIKTFFLLPATSAQDLVKYGITKVAESKGWIHFKTEVGETVISCRIFEGEYPDTTPYFKVKGRQFDLPKALPNTLIRAAVFAKREHELDEEVTITLEKNRIKIRGNSETGWFEETLNAHYDEEPVSFVVNPAYLQSILEQVTQCTLGKDRLRFESKGKWEHVISLKADEKQTE
jgi:DNA polymerase III sliding clamp (beta) subunit (PCNA family)